MRAPATVFDRLPIWAWLVALMVLVTGTAVVINDLMHERALHAVLDNELSNQAQRTGLAVQAEIDLNLAQLQRQVLAPDPAAAGATLRTLQPASRGDG